MSKIKILGAGPSGLSAAINLSKSGYGVEVYERKGELGGDLMAIYRDWRTGPIGGMREKSSKA